jgi:hypothetical protein
MEKYYFKTKGHDADEHCTERCMVHNDGIMIGSFSCQICEHNAGSGLEPRNGAWIKCKLLTEATKKSA